MFIQCLTVTPLKKRVLSAKRHTRKWVVLLWERSYGGFADILPTADISLVPFVKWETLELSEIPDISEFQLGG